MGFDDEVDALVAHVHANQLRPAAKLDHRGWPEIGAVIVDAVLQRRSSYEKVVRPRVDAVRAALPGPTTADFLAVAESPQFESLIDYKSDARKAQMRQMALVLSRLEIESIADLARALSGEQSRASTRTALWVIHGVGRKTLNYLGVLVGLDECAVDVHLRSFGRAAGLAARDDAGWELVYRAAAKRLDIPVGNLDGAAWRHQSKPGAQRASSGRHLRPVVTSHHD
jgi:endonuclease III